MINCRAFLRPNYNLIWKGYGWFRRYSEERICLAKYTIFQIASLGETPNTPNNKKIKGGEIIARRTRPFAYNFRASEQEKNLIDSAIAKSGLTITDFVIRSIIDKPITVIENGNEILAELKRQGNNLNQVARKSYNGLATEEEIKACIKSLKELYLQISIAIGGG